MGRETNAVRSDETDDTPVESVGDRRPVVWIVNRGGHPYDAAKEYGRLLALTSGQVNHFATDRFAYMITQRLSMATADDFVLISGSPMLNIIAALVWITKFRKIKLLQWSDKQSRYILRTLTMRDIHRLVKEADTLEESDEG